MRVPNFSIRRFNVTILLFLFLSPGLFGQARTHTVVKGDTLFSLARHYGVSVEQIVKQNKLTSAAAIKIGQKLVLEAASSPAASPKESPGSSGKVPVVQGGEKWKPYRIAKGDTLYSLAKHYQVALKSLMAVNGLKQGAVIKPGQYLRVPPVENAADINRTLPAWEPELPDNSGERLTAGNLSWPVKGTIHRLTGKVPGIQINSSAGAPVVSISSGTVMRAEAFRGFGKIVVIQNKEGYYYTYCGNEQIFVREGDRVQPGVRIGTVGVNPHDKQAKVILMTHLGEKVVDPVKAPRH